MTQHHKHENGFTLVELMLAMAFISMLLLAIAMLTLNISGIYNKGLTMRAVNEAGQLISSDLQRTLGMSRPKVVKYAVDPSSTPTGGRLCADQTVYAWNYAGALKAGTSTNPNASSFNQYSTATGPPPAKAIRFVRFQGDALYCEMVAGSYPDIPQGNVTDLLDSGDVDLAVSKFTINEEAPGIPGQPVTGDSSQRLYQISVVLGTSEQGIISSNVNGCAAPANQVDDQYCAVSQFEFIARAGSQQ